MNIHDTPPFVYNKGNCVISRNLDIIFCYRVELPERHSLSEEGYDEFHTMLDKTFRFFAKTVVHKLDYFVNTTYQGEDLKEETYMQRVYKKHHKGKHYVRHESYCFFVWTLHDLVDKDVFLNPFKAIKNEKDLVARLEEIDFKQTVENAISYANSTKKIHFQELDSKGIEDVCAAYFSGLRERAYTDVKGNPNNKEALQVGSRYADIFTFHSLRQISSQVTNTVMDKQLSKNDRSFYQGMSESFGVSIPYDHVVNQIYYMPEHKDLFRYVEKKQSEFYSARGFGLNSGPAESLKQFLKESEGNINSRLVRFHFNIILFTDSKEESKAAKQAVTNTFIEHNIRPYQPYGKALKALYVNSFFAFSALMPSRFNFICELGAALCFFLPTTNYRSDKEGVYFTDRTFMVPIRKDVIDKAKRRIKASNFFIVAPTGQGKSVVSNTLVYQWLEQGYKVCINDLGSSFINLYRHYKKDSLMLNFEPGKPLGINPFGNAPENASSEDILATNEVLNLLHFRGAKTREEIPTSHNVTLRTVIDQYYKHFGPGERDMKSFYKFLEFVHKAKKYEDMGIDLQIHDPSAYMGELIYSLSEFTSGVYSYLFDPVKEGAFEISKDTKFVYFEFDKAKDDTVISGLLQLYSYEATRKVIWEDKSVRGIQLYDEYAKQIKNPLVASTSEYIAQAIRKQNGSCGFVIQSVNQLPTTSTIGSILDNTSVYYILPTDKNHDETADRLKLGQHNRYMLNSIESDVTGEQPYTEIFLLIGKYGSVVRNQLPREHWYMFQTEGDLYDHMGQVYEKYGDMPSTIEELMKN